MSKHVGIEKARIFHFMNRLKSEDRYTLIKKLKSKLVKILNSNSYGKIIPLLDSILRNNLVPQKIDKIFKFLEALENNRLSKKENEEIIGFLKTEQMYHDLNKLDYLGRHSFIKYLKEGLKVTSKSKDHEIMEEYIEKQVSFEEMIDSLSFEYIGEKDSSAKRRFAIALSKNIFSGFFQKYEIILKNMKSFKTQFDNELIEIHTDLDNRDFSSKDCPIIDFLLEIDPNFLFGKLIKIGWPSVREKNIGFTRSIVLSKKASLNFRKLKYESKSKNKKNLAKALTKFLLELTNGDYLTIRNVLSLHYMYDWIDIKAVHFNKEVNLELLDIHPGPAFKKIGNTKYPGTLIQMVHYILRKSKINDYGILNSLNDFQIAITAGNSARLYATRTFFDFMQSFEEKRLGLDKEDIREIREKIIKGIMPLI
jgi:hypothetical protein